MTRTVAALAALLALAPIGARADLFTGNDLLNYYRNSPSLFYQYVFGVIDGMRADSAWHSASTFFCFPDGVTYQQAGDIVAKYLIDDPTDRHYPGSSLIGIAIAGAFPCRQK
jgi:hypothetical protein